MKILNITSFSNKNTLNNDEKQKINFGSNVYTGEKFLIDHADILVTHACNKGCPTCIDKWVNKYRQIVSFDIVKKYFNMLEQLTTSVRSVVNKDGQTLINILGGEPTVVGEDFLNKIAENAHIRNFLIWVSTNGIKRKTVDSILPNFDLVRVTVDTPEEALKWADSKFIDKLDIKFPCTEKTTLGDFERFAELTKDFPNRMMVVYNDKFRKEVTLQPDLAEMLNSSNVNYEVSKHGFQKYGKINGVTIKRTIQEDNHFADTRMIPRLYPNGNYNCTWENELNDPYLGELQNY